MPEGSEVESMARNTGWPRGPADPEAEVQGAERGPERLSENQLKYHLPPFFLLQAWD